MRKTFRVSWSSLPLSLFSIRALSHAVTLPGSDYHMEEWRETTFLLQPPLLNPNSMGNDGGVVLVLVI